MYNTASQASSVNKGPVFIDSILKQSSGETFRPEECEEKLRMHS